MESLSFKTIIATVRPPRIAVLVHTSDPHWQNTCVRVLEFFTQLWGGHYNIIVPTDGKTIDPVFWAMLAAFDPDYVYSYRLTGRDIRANTPEQFEKQVAREMVQFDLGQREIVEEALAERRYTDFEVDKELAESIKRRLVPFFYKDNIVGRLVSDSTPHFPLTTVLDVLPLHRGGEPQLLETFRRSTDKISDLWLASAFGAISPSFEKALSDAQILVKPVDVNGENLAAVVVEGAEADQITRITPFWLTKYELSSYRSFKFPSYEEPGVVVVGDALEDFCLYQCLSRLRGGAVWLPSSVIEESGYPIQLAHIAMHLRSNAQSHEVSLWSKSLSAEGVQALVDRIKGTGGSVTAGYVPGRALRHRRFVLARQNTPKPIAGQFLGNALVGFVETPKPAGFSHPTNHRWITDIEIRDYLPPRHPELAYQTVGVRGDTQDVRTTKWGWAYCCPHEGTYFGGELDAVTVRPTIKILEVPDVMAALGRNCQLRFSPSEKGAFASDFIAKFGSLDGAARFLRNQQHRSLLNKFLSTARVARGTFDEGVYTQGRRYLDLPAIEKILGTRETATSLLDDLLQKRVFYRGLVFQCKFCRNADWYSIARVSESFECSRCGKVQTYSKENWKRPDEPSWYYKLDEVVYQGYKNGMLAPILTNECLRGASSSFQFAAEQEVFEGAGTEPLMEIDICAIADGELVIGESKRTSEIEKSTRDRRRVIENYLKLAQRIGAHEVVFSTICDSWSPATLAEIQQAFRNSELGLRVLTSKELL